MSGPETTQPTLISLDSVPVDENLGIGPDGKRNAKRKKKAEGNCHHKQFEYTVEWKVAGITKAQPTGDRD